jgi:acetyl-CoA acyltransferase 2
MKHGLGAPIWFLSAKRTPFGTFMGKLADMSATDLAVHASVAAIKESLVNPNDIDQTIFGNVLQTSKDAIYLARHVGLKSGLKIEAPAVTVNRLCGSGFEAIVQGARLLKTGEAHCVLVGGTESLSQAPHVIRGARKGLALGRGELEDSLWSCLSDSYVDMPMAITAENLAEQYAISQNEVDEYSLQSQQRYQKALAEGAFKREITAIEGAGPKANISLAEDEHPRKDASLAAMQKLPKVFKKNGVIHAGAASGICDGAAALVMCSDQFVTERKLKPLGEFLHFGVSGCDPKIMGIGPVLAIKNCLQDVKASLEDMSMIEVNEAFAPQVLAVMKELKINEAKLNINGGAIALGHPLGASGARITAHLLHALKAQSGALGLGSACIGGGQGIAVMVRAI